jgi:para-aminobenzoate synthetase/4-amino-4-deoxychorismate lyase
VGGGVTWDSSAADEHAEVLAKAAVLGAEAPPFSLLETLRLDDGTFWLGRRHLDRLRASATYFGRPDPVVAATEALDRVAAAHPAGRWRVRLLVEPGGRAATEVYPLAPTAGPVPVLRAREPVDSSDVFLQHKTTHRAAYAPARRLLAQHPGSYDVLLHNERGELTELTTGNVVLDLDGTRCTPPLDCGLLGGVERAEALAAGRLMERVLRPIDLDRAAAVWLLNSVRGWLPVRVVPGAE